MALTRYVRINEDNFWDFVHKDQSGCWLWKRGKTSKGYGSLRAQGKFWLAHRYAFYIKNGFNAKFACHKCNVPACCNPDHLYNGDAKSNFDDMMAAGTFIKPPRLPKVLDSEKAYQIKSLLKDGVSQHNIARIIGCSRSLVNHINNGRCWRE